MKKTIRILIGLLFLGCATAPGGWYNPTKPGANREALYQCNQEATRVGSSASSYVTAYAGASEQRSGPYTDNNTFRLCMGAKGFNYYTHQELEQMGCTFAPGGLFRCP
jgi:hypothetical protein